MSASKKELELIGTLLTRAHVVKAELAGFFADVQTLNGVAKDRPLIHQVVKQALATAGVSKLMENIDTELKKLLDDVPRTDKIVTEAFALGGLIVPAYDYVPVLKIQPKLTNKDSNADKLRVLQAIIDSGDGGAIESRLVASKFDDETPTGRALIRACGNAIFFEDKEDWSITKHK